MRKHGSWILPAGGALLVAGSTLVRGGVKAPSATWEKHLFVWAGDQQRKAPDFLAVVDFDKRSPAYGKLITTLPVPDPSDKGNEPHHVGLSADGRVLACGGLLSAADPPRSPSATSSIRSKEAASW